MATPIEKINLLANQIQVKERQLNRAYFQPSSNMVDKEMESLFSIFMVR